MKQEVWSLHSAARQRYYAAIVREASARRALDDRQFEEEVQLLDPRLYEDIGKKSLAAFTNLLDALAGARVSAADDARDARALEALEQQLSSLVEAIEGVRRDLGAFVSRTDRMLLELSRRLDAVELGTARGAEYGGGELPDQRAQREQRDDAGAPAGAVFHAGNGEARRVAAASRQARRGEYKRVPKEQTLNRILEAARELATQGRKVTLAECARHANVAYYKAVYACKDSEELAKLMA